MKMFNWLVLASVFSAAYITGFWGNSFVSAARLEFADIAPTATPTPNTTSRPRQAQTATPSPTATPVTVSTPTPAPAAVQTIDELQSKIRQRLFAPEVRRGRVGVKVVSLNSGKVIFDNDSDKYFMPASNMKNFTVAAAMEKLGADFKFVTSVYANSLPDTTGTIKGDLRIYGRGDVSISTAFNNGDYYKGIDNLVDKIAAAGVRRIEGSIIGDESYFKGFYIPGTWEWDDLQAYYGAEVTALPINDNAVDISVMPGANGSPCLVTISPANSLFQINNLCTTGSSSRELSVVKKIDRNVIDVSGWLPVGNSGFKSSIAITKPAELFVALLKQRLELRGIIVTGSSRLQPQTISADPAQIEIAKLESVPFSVIAAKTMKPSQNMFTETILWTLGVETYLRERRGTIPGISDGVKWISPAPREDSSVLGIKAVKAFLKEIGGADDGILQYDGSGLSRHDLITPSAVVTLYTHMAKQSKYAKEWRESLTIAGVDGTLANRLRGTAAEANFRGKTGTIDQVSALSGYMTTAAGEQLVVSIIINNVGGATRTRTSLADDIVISLANFNGKIG